MSIVQIFQFVPIFLHKHPLYNVTFFNLVPVHSGPSSKNSKPFRWVLVFNESAWKVNEYLLKLVP